MSVLHFLHFIAGVFFIGLINFTKEGRSWGTTLEDDFLFGRIWINWTTFHLIYRDLPLKKYPPFTGQYSKSDTK